MRENIQYQLWYSFYLGASQILRISSVPWTTSQQTLMSPKLSVQSEVSTDNNILVSVRFEMICKKLFWVERVTDQFKILCRHMFNLLWQLFIWGQLICWLCCNSWPFRGVFPHWAWLFLEKIYSVLLENGGESWFPDIIVCCLRYHPHSKTGDYKYVGLVYGGFLRI